MTMKSALITGAASGIGKACAERMAREGYGAVVADVNMPAAEELVKALTAEGLSAIAVRMDVSATVNVLFPSGTMEVAADVPILVCENVIVGEVPSIIWEKGG